MEQPLSDKTNANNLFPWYWCFLVHPQTWSRAQSIQQFAICNGAAGPNQLPWCFQHIFGTPPPLKLRFVHAMAANVPNAITKTQGTVCECVPIAQLPIIAGRKCANERYTGQSKQTLWGVKRSQQLCMKRIMAPMSDGGPAATIVFGPGKAEQILIWKMIIWVRATIRFVSDQVVLRSGRTQQSPTNPLVAENCFLLGKRSAVLKILVGICLA